MLQCIVQASQPTINVQTRPFATLRCCQGSDRARSPCLSDFLSPGSVWPLLTRLAQASLLCFFSRGGGAGLGGWMEMLQGVLSWLDWT